MSLVGPRPERPELQKEIEKEVPEFGLRLQAKAGLTGYAQVYGKYNTNVALTTNVYYGTLYLVVKDFENNYFTNMIIYEVDKDDMSIFKTRTYSEIDLLYNYNEDINVLPEFDANQMKEYQSLKKKLDEIL